MNIDIRDHGDTREIMLSGQMSFGDNVEFRAVIDGLRQNIAKNCTLDVTDLQSIDSAGLGMFVLAIDVAAEQGSKIAIRSPQGQVKKMLDIARFSELVTIIE